MARASERSLSVEEIHLALLQAIPDGMCFMDLNGSVRFWNDAAETVSGFSIAEAVCAPRGEDVLFITDSDGRRVNPHLVVAGAVDGKPGIHFLRHKDGHHLPILLRRVAVRTRNHEPMGVLSLFARSESYSSQAEPRNHSAGQWPDPGSHPAAILVIQIDNFERTSLQLGPEAAEKLFLLVEQTTTGCLKDDDWCGRVRDGVLLASIMTASPQYMLELAERLRVLIQSSRIQWWGEEVQITASIGAALMHPHDAIADATARAEDCALRAKQGGGNQVLLSSCSSSSGTPSQL